MTRHTYAAYARTSSLSIRFLMAITLLCGEKNKCEMKPFPHHFPARLKNEKG